MAILKIIYLANIVVAGWISMTSLFAPRMAQQIIFADAVQYSEVIRLVGALWAAIFILSCLGLVYPLQVSLVLVFQLIYKSLWLAAVALPSLIKGTPFPIEMALFFLIWVIILPFIIPWSHVFAT